MSDLTDERGSVYGPPLTDFSTVVRMMRIWHERYADKHGNPAHTDWDDALGHAVYMVIVKLVRLAWTPDHVDSWKDIGGYADCALQILGETDNEETVNTD